MSGLTGNIGRTTSIQNQSGEKPIRRILIVRPNSRLGNQLLLTPLLQEIEDTLPDVKVDLFVRGNLAPILFQNYKCIDRYIKLPPKPFKELMKYVQTWISMRKYHYDLVFNVDSGSSSGRLATQFVNGRIKFFGDREESLLRIPEYKHMGRWPVYNFRLYLSMMGYKMAETPVKPLSLFLSAEEKSNGRAVLESLVKNSKPTIMVYTFATGDKCLSKEWWQQMYGKLVARYGNDYNLLEVLPKEKVSQIDFQATSYYSTDIREMGATIGQGAVFITGDCGVMHLASSVGIPTVGLFSSSSIETYKPYNEGSFAVHTNDVDTDALLQSVDGILAARKH